MKNFDEFIAWFNLQDKDTKIVIVLCVTVLLIILILVFVNNPLAGIGLTALIGILQGMLKRGGEPNEREKS